MLGCIIDGIPYLVNIISFDEGPGRTSVHTLSAIGTNHFKQWMLKEGRDLHVLSPVSYIKGAYTLEFFAGSYTTLATNTTAVILNDGLVVFINRVFFIRYKIDEHRF